MTTRNAPSAHRPTRIFHGPIDNGRFRASAVSSNCARSDGRASRTYVASRAGSAPHTSWTSRASSVPNAGRTPAAPQSHRHRAHSGRTTRTLAALCILLMFALVHAAVANLGILPDSAATARPEVAHSTPISQWRLGEVPHLYQIDPQWSDEPYAGGTIGENGCGPTCLSMVYVALTGNTDIGPFEASRISEAQGHTVDGMTAWTLMSDGAASLGLRSWEVSPTVDAVRAELAAGHPVICSVVPGDFTTTGHFIVLAGLTEDGQLIVRDPNSEHNSSQPWEIERMLGQCANLWAFSA